MTAQEFIRQELDAGRLTLAHIEALTRDAQAGRPGLLKVDGKPGDKTRAALEASFPGLFPAPGTNLDRLELAGLKALAKAKRLFALDVFDPKPGDNSARGVLCKTQITQLFKDSGWGWALKGKTYAGDGADPDQSWCGVFAHECWRAAGLKPSIDHWASTWRMANSIGNDPGAEGRTVSPDGTWKAGFTPRAGDIVIMGDGDPAWGEHIGILDYIDQTGWVHTYEGNGTGTGPDGKPREGIVRGLRPLIGKWRVLRFYRPPLDALTL